MAQGPTIYQNQHPKIKPILSIYLKEKNLRKDKLNQFIKSSSKASLLGEAAFEDGISSFQDIKKFAKIFKAQNRLSKLQYSSHLKDHPKQALFSVKEIGHQSASLSSLDLKFSGSGGTYSTKVLKNPLMNLSALKNLSHLTLWFEHPGVLDVKTFKNFKYLKRIKNLTNLSLKVSNYTFNQVQFRALSVNLTKLTQLRSLETSFNEVLGITAQELHILASRLPKLHSLTKIDLDFRSFVSSNLAEFFKGFATMKALTDITCTLQPIPEGNYSAKVQKSFSEALECLENPSLRKFKFSFFESSLTKGLVALSKFLKRQNNLTHVSLTLFGGSQITNTGISKLSSALKSLHSLTFLELTFTGSLKLDADASQPISKVLPSLKNLAFVKLGWTLTNDAHSEKLVKNLGLLKSLKYLSLSLNCQALKTLAGSLNKLNLLQDLSLGIWNDYSMPSKEIESFAEALQNIKSLSYLTLDFQHIPFEQKAIDKLGKMIQSLPSLYFVSVSFSWGCKLPSLSRIFGALNQGKNIAKVNLMLPDSEKDSEELKILMKRKVHNVSFFSSNFLKLLEFPK